MDSFRQFICVKLLRPATEQFRGFTAENSAIVRKITVGCWQSLSDESSSVSSCDKEFVDGVSPSHTRTQITSRSSNILSFQMLVGQYEEVFFLYEEEEDKLPGSYWPETTSWSWSEVNIEHIINSCLMNHKYVMLCPSAFSALWLVLSRHCRHKVWK